MTEKPFTHDESKFTDEESDKFIEEFSREIRETLKIYYPNEFKEFRIKDV